MTYLNITHKEFYNAAKQLLLDKGRCRELVKGDYLCRIGDKTNYIGLVAFGALKYSCPNSCGLERIISFSFTGDLVGCYSSMRNDTGSLFDIVALESTTVYQLSLWELDALLGENRRLEFAETLSFMLLQKVIEDCCLTALERYLALCRRFPDIHNRLTNRNIAHYLGITPESFSRMRKRLLIEY